MTNFIVSARKYRPTTFDEVIGQDHVAKTLKKALKADQLAHSFLFCGPRGVGKTTCARILAKVINCENPKDNAEPCNTCPSCVGFNDSSSFNIIELDAASNNSVESMRQLIEQVRFQPQHGTHKVFIIDEVHMLSTSAFNAFLKTLEEPPSYAIFILATTEKHKILPTILSRCQIFDFKRIQPAAVIQQLDYILKEENKTADPEALHLIGQKADGAMRDALSIYDKIAGASDAHISYQDVIRNLNILDYDYYFKAVDAIIREDMSQVMLILNEVINQGFDVDQFIQGLGAHMRDLLVCKDKRTMVLLDVSDSLKDRYAAQSELISMGHLLSALDILNQCDVSLKQSTNKRLYVEIALNKIVFLPSATEVQLGPASEKKKSIATDQPKEADETPKIEKEIEASPKPSMESPVIEEERADYHKPEQTPEVKAENPPEKVETPEPKTEAVSEKMESTQSSGSSLLVDIDLKSIVSNIKKKEKERAAAQSNLSIEGINDIWASYSEKVTSQSVKTALNNCIRDLDGKSLKITVPSALIKNMILEEGDLLTRLREELGTYDLIYDFDIDKSQFKDFIEHKKKEVKSENERFQILNEKHPELEVLMKRLGLKKNNQG